jgi:hypothetical protein
MGDADQSYDFSEIDRFVKKFRKALNWSWIAACRVASGESCRVRRR